MVMVNQRFWSWFVDVNLNNTISPGTRNSSISASLEKGENQVPTSELWTSDRVWWEQTIATDALERKIKFSFFIHILSHFFLSYLPTQAQTRWHTSKIPHSRVELDWAERYSYWLSLSLYYTTVCSVLPGWYLITILFNLILSSLW